MSQQMSLDSASALSPQLLAGNAFTSRLASSSPFDVRLSSVSGYYSSKKATDLSVKLLLFFFSLKEKNTNLKP